MWRVTPSQEGVNFQVTVLEILGELSGMASPSAEDLKRDDTAILAAGGRDWAGPDQAPRRAQVPILDITAWAGRTHSAQRMAQIRAEDGRCRVHGSPARCNRTDPSALQIEEARPR